MRELFAAAAVGGFVGVAICDAIAREWKTAIISVLFAIANSIILWWK